MNYYTDSAEYIFYYCSIPGKLPETIFSGNFSWKANFPETASPPPAYAVTTTLFTIFYETIFPSFL